MPYKSNQQRKFFHSAGATKAGITSKEVKEFDTASKGKKLPNKVKTKKKKKSAPLSGKQMLGKAVNKLNAPKQLSQRDSYAKDMNRAIKTGGSNGIGVGY